MEKQFLEALEWRYAAKRMNGKAIPAEALQRVLEAIRLSPSSMGFAPYTILIVRDKSIREKLLPHTFNQPQVIESDCVLVFASWTSFTEEQVESYMDQITQTRNVERYTLDGFAASITKKIKESQPNEVREWAEKQTYIALGFGIAAAAVERIDATPMEGFIPASVNQVLGLEKLGLNATCLLALGYRDEEKDFLASAKKVRRPHDELFIEI